MAVLLEMNDHVTALLKKVDIIMSGTEEIHKGVLNSGRHHSGGGGGGHARRSDTSSHISYTNEAPGFGTPSDYGGYGHGGGHGNSFTHINGASGTNNNNNVGGGVGGSQGGFPSVVSAVYALRRGGTREQTLCAVDNLIQLCYYGGSDLCLPAVKQMTAAGTCVGIRIAAVYCFRYRILLLLFWMILKPLFCCCLRCFLVHFLLFPVFVKYFQIIVLLLW
jgi:hypothetical protein